MHFFKKTVGLMAVLCVMPAAFAATARPSVVAANVGTASSRMPTMVVKTSATASTSGTTTSAALLADKECIDAYTACIKDADACGEGFEECTTKVLFHGKMPNCLSTLAQCSSAGVNSLFGTSNIAALASGEIKNTYGEITDYTYPTNGSVLGQMITAAAITNQYDTSTCVRRYTACLKKDSVCGNDFELCTTNRDFRKQRVFCDSTLARCQSEGVIELLGSSNRTAEPTASSRIGEMITEGAALAAVNAVSTCYKVVDQCFIGSCAENPYKCYENANQSLVDIVEAINNGTEITTEMVDVAINGSSIRAYIKNSCLETIGSNKYCYATFIGDGKMPTNAQLRDEDNQEDIFDAAYDSRMNMGMKAKIADLVDKFDTRAKQKCTETIKSCAMRVCGGGVGSACYAAVFGNADKSINGSATYSEIKNGCAPIVNTDTYCKYAAANPNSTGTYSYTYINREAFDILFPEYDNGAGVDVIGVVASLNSALATNYSDAAIAQLKKQCQSVASSCVKSMCGSEYTNCYRTRTDVASSLTQSGNSAFDASMNKVGGVLDYTIVLGLCLDTVKNASVCEEHLAIEANKIKIANAGTSSWGEASSVREGWIDAGAATKVTGEVQTMPLTDAYGNKLCRTQDGDEGICYTTNDAGKVYDIEETIDYTTYVQNQAASTLFKDLIYDIEKEAQAQYNAKLTHEQQMCYAANSSGILGTKDMGSTFMWAKLNGNRVPKDYTVNGLKQTAFKASNDLYGSFCRVRVTLQSDDKDIQDYMKNKSWTTAYFAVGDAFTCGSWIPSDDLEKLSEDVATKKLGMDESGRLTTGQKWGVAGATILSTILGGVGTDMLQTQTGLGGLLKTTKNTTKSNDAPQALDTCMSMAGKFNDYKCTASSCSSKEMQDMKTELASLAAYVKNNVNTLDGVEVIVLDGVLAKPANATDVTAIQNAAVKVYNSCADSKNKLATDNTQNQANGTKWNRIGRGVLDAAGATATGVTGFFMTRDLLRESNKNQLTAEQQEWMNKVGRHITCYIGGDEAGNYGDVITTSLE